MPIAVSLTLLMRPPKPGEKPMDYANYSLDCHLGVLCETIRDKYNLTPFQALCLTARFIEGITASVESNPPTFLDKMAAHINQQNIN